MSLLIKTTEDQTFEIDVQGSTFQVCPITASESARIYKQHAKYRNGQIEPEAQKRIIAEKFKRTVKGWKNVQDVTGNDVPYSDELRDNFAELNQDWASLIIMKAEQNQAEISQEEDDNLGE
jgi:hypothetical protein